MDGNRAIVQSKAMLIVFRWYKRKLKWFHRAFNIWNRPLEMHGSEGSCINVHYIAGAIDKSAAMELLRLMQKHLNKQKGLICCDAISMVSCQKGPTRHAYAWQIGPIWQDTLDMWCWYISFPCNIHLYAHRKFCLWSAFVGNGLSTFTYHIMYSIIIPL